MPTALQNRKFAKTCVEKKRRDRINKCLDELKDLMAQSDDKARYQKMEKAEILEMAVAYMRNIRLNNPNHSFANNNNTASTTNDLLYTQVYAKCLSDVQNFVCHLPDIHDEVKTGLVAHLAQLNQTTTTTTTTTAKKTNKTNLVKGSPAKKLKKNFSPQQQQQYDEDVFMNSTNEQRMNQMSIMTNTSCSNSSSSQNVSSSLDSSYYSPYLYHHNTNTNEINRNEIMSPALSDSEHVLNTSSSPSLSQCSSPISSSSSSSTSSVTCMNNEFRFNGNFELYQSVGFLKMWRPW